MARLLGTVAAASAAGALALAGNALAEPGPSDGFGWHVASCAQEHLGQREGTPTVTCAHDGMPMTFATFGAMVAHMRNMHGA